MIDHFHIHSNLFLLPPLGWRSNDCNIPLQPSDFVINSRNADRIFIQPVAFGRPRSPPAKRAPVNIDLL